VKLMGRQSGYITMYATIASGQVDIVLIPEVRGFISYIQLHNGRHVGFE
jgi:6-phosphofructokinase